MHSPNSSIVGRLRAATAALAAALCLAATLAPAAAVSPGPRTEQPIGPGVRLLQWSDPAGPNALQAVEMDLREPLTRLGVSLGGGETLALEPVSQQAKRSSTESRYAIAGVNGDFFYYPGMRQPGNPTSAALLGDELVRTPFGRSCLVVPASGPPSIRIFKADASVTLPDGTRVTLTGVNGPPKAGEVVLYTPRWGSSTHTDIAGTEVFLQPEEFPLHYGATHTAKVRAVQRGVGDGAIQPGTWVLSARGAAGDAFKNLAPGDALKIRIAFEPGLNPGDQVLGGGPRLLRDGQISVEAEGGSLGDSFAKARHPRTAVGFNQGKLVLLVCDGRLPGYSAGMTLPEMAQALADLGCTDGMNLDGGGSSTLWARGKIVNRPSDGRERAVANALLVFSTAPVGPAVSLAPTPREIYALPGAAAALSAEGQDRYYNPVSVPVDRIEWRVDPDLGRVEGGRFIAADNVGGVKVGSLAAVSGDLRGEVAVHVLTRPARVEILPARTRLGTEAQAAFRVRAYDEAGRLLALPQSLKWDTTGGIGAVDASGALKTGSSNGTGAVRVVIGGVTAEAQVEVAAGIAAALDDFETKTDWTVRLTSGATGTVRVAEGMARSGKRALRLEYDLSGSGSRAVYALANRDLGQPLALKAWVYGDGQGAWLRVRVKDRTGATHLLDAVRNVDWNGEWREVRIPISEDFPSPITLDALYVVETDAAKHPKGALLIDDLTVER